MARPAFLRNPAKLTVYLQPTTRDRARVLVRSQCTTISRMVEAALHKKAARNLDLGEKRASFTMSLEKKSLRTASQLAVKQGVTVSDLVEIILQKELKRAA